MCGALPASSFRPIVPQVVASFTAYEADVSTDIAGSFFQVFCDGAPFAGLSHGSGALDGVGAAARSDTSSLPPASPAVA